MVEFDSASPLGKSTFLARRAREKEDTDDEPRDDADDTQLSALAGSLRVAGGPVYTDASELRARVVRTTVVQRGASLCVFAPFALLRLNSLTRSLSDSPTR